MKFLITIPVYNEEKRLERGVRELSTFLQRHQLPARIDIADNGSQDRTREIARQLSRELSNVSLTEVPERGVGFALQTSWDEVGDDIVGYMDVDLSTDLNHFLEVVRLFQKQNVDVVNGSRLRAGAKVLGRSALREVTSRGFNFLLRILLDSKITDGMCGFKFIKRTRYEELRKFGLRRKDWFFNTELLIRAEWLGFSICEIPVLWQDEPGSNVNVLKLSRHYFLNILELRRERGRKL